VPFVNHLEEVPEGSRLIFSAHGVSPDIKQEAKEKNLKTLDATCPLVTKVHLEAIRFSKKGYHIFLIGHADHVEVRGTYGEAPEHITIIEPVKGASMVEIVEQIQVPQKEKLIYLTQTTLSINDCSLAVTALRSRFPSLESPPKDDICYATTNRQSAVMAASTEVDFFVVIGSPNSSNSRRLVEVSKDSGVEASLFQDVDQICQKSWHGIHQIGITAGASTPAVVINRIINKLESLGFCRESDLVFAKEDTEFLLPNKFRKSLKNKGFDV